MSLAIKSVGPKKRAPESALFLLLWMLQPSYILRRYSPPTSYRAWLIWPSELYFTASIPKKVSQKGVRDNLDLPADDLPAAR